MSSNSSLQVSHPLEKPSAACPADFRRGWRETFKVIPHRPLNKPSIRPASQYSHLHTAPSLHGHRERGLIRRGGGGCLGLFPLQLFPSFSSFSKLSHIITYWSTWSSVMQRWWEEEQLSWIERWLGFIARGVTAVNTCTRPHKCVFVCEVNTSKVIIWEFMRLFIPSINGPTTHMICAQLNICVFSTPWNWLLIITQS